jgi:hypothetical protein
MADKRLHNLTAKTTMTDDYLLLVNDGNTGSEKDFKIKWSDLLAQMTTLFETNSNGNIYSVLYSNYGLGNITDLDDIATGETLDGEVLVAGDLVFINNSVTDLTLNGIYEVAAAGSVARWDHHNSIEQMYNGLVFVAGGTANYTKFFRGVAIPGTTIGVDDLLYIHIVDLPKTYFDLLVGGNNTTLHYHSADRARANHTGTQLLSTISDISLYGGFYSYKKSIPFNITVADTYQAFRLVTAGDVLVSPAGINGFTFNAGRVVDPNIASEANGTGGKLRIICNIPHLLTTGDIVVIGNSGTAGGNAAHNKPTFITTDGTNPTTEFLCDDINYVAGAGASAGTVDEPSHLHASVGSAGIYTATFVIDGTAINANKSWKWELNTNLIANDNIVSERTTTNTLANMSSSGNIVVADGDIIWLSGKNITDTTDYTIKNMNLHVHKIGSV